MANRDSEPSPPAEDPPASSDTGAGTGMPPFLDEEALADLRRRIDEVDQRLIDALTDRARIVTEVGRAKRESGYPIYAPHREQAVLARVLAMNPGPLPGRTVEAIYRELMSGSFVLEQAIRVAYLGPRGSFSHLAATRHFGSSVDFESLERISDVFGEVAAGRSTYGLVPYENSTRGGITDTLDAFMESEGVSVYAEALVEIRHHLLANIPADSIRRVLSKPQALAQCRRFLERRFPNATLQPTLSTSDAVRQVAEFGSTGDAAAIGSAFAGELYGVNPLFESIQDTANNITRFLVIARTEAQPSEDDRTTILFTTAHKPGALVEALQVFEQHGLNLSHIEKRPSGRENWQYTFFVDVDAHRADPQCAAAIESLRSLCVEVRVLGSYPRAQRIL